MLKSLHAYWPPNSKQQPRVELANFGLPVECVLKISIHLSECKKNGVFTIDEIAPNDRWFLD